MAEINKVILNDTSYSIGGGTSDEKEIELLIDFTVSEEQADATQFVFTSDEYPEIENIKTLVFRMVMPAQNSSNSKWFDVYCGNKIVLPFSQSQIASYGVAKVFDGLWYYGIQSSTNLHATIVATLGAGFNAPGGSVQEPLRSPTWEKFTQIKLVSYGKFLQAGTNIKIWGC